ATRLLDVPVEALDQRLGGLVAVARRAAQVELCLAHRQGNPPGHARYELRQVTQRERFLVRLPRSLVARHSLEQAPRGRHLLVEFGEERFGNAHESLGRLRWDRPTEALGEPNRGRTLRPGPIRVNRDARDGISASLPASAPAPTPSTVPGSLAPHAASPTCRPRRAEASAACDSPQETHVPSRLERHSSGAPARRVWS